MDRKELIERLKTPIGNVQYKGSALFELDLGFKDAFTFDSSVVHEAIKMLAADGERILSLQNRVSEGEAEVVELKHHIDSLSAELTRTVGKLAKAEQTAIDDGDSGAVKNLKKLVHDFQLRVDSTCARLSEVSVERDHLKKIADTADRWRDLARNRGGQIGYLLKELDKYKVLASGKGNATVVCQKTPPAWDEIEEKLADAVRERDELRSALTKAYQERDQYMELVSGMKSDHDYLIERVHKLADMVVWYGMELARHGVCSVTEDEDVIAAYNRKYNAHKTDAVLFRRDM